MFNLFYPYFNAVSFLRKNEYHASIQHTDMRNSLEDEKTEAKDRGNCMPNPDCGAASRYDIAAGMLHFH